jgi:guanylate kinase
MPGHLIVFSAPGGVGKDSVIRGLLATLPDCVRNITTTSRPMREGETEGRDYYFLTAEQFKEKIERGDFIEYNYFTGNYYGIERKRLNALLAAHRLVITQADINGKKSLDREGIPHLAIFLLPDNLEVLRGRLEKRGSMSPEGIAERLRIAEIEMKEAPSYDLQIINREGKLDETIAELAKIIEKRVA